MARMATDICEARGIYWRLYQLQYKDQETNGFLAPVREASVAPAV